ncbi:MAG: threonine synthase [Bacillota bacterium]
MSRKWRGIIEEYWAYLPVTDRTPGLTLLEGGTPLLRAGRLLARAGLNDPLPELYLKFEGGNPTGSFKDRGMVVAVARAVEQGSEVVMCASTGNTAASAAAYSARAGIGCVVVVPSGNVALGKLAQAIMYGARVLAVEGTFDRALEVVRELVEQYPAALVNSVNPDRIEGQKTAAFEVCDALGDAPGYLALPVGNAGNITAWWKGFGEYRARGQCTRLPRLLGFQAAGAAPLVLGSPVPDPRTLATAIKIGNPASWEGAVRARDESNGAIDAVTDHEIVEAYRLLAAAEGVFVEPASAAPVAGVIKWLRQGRLPDRGPVVAVLTGHGLKDPATALDTAGAPEVVPASVQAIAAAAGLARAGRP